MTLLAGAAWTPTDDDGTGNTGTPINAAWVAAIKASIETEVHSAANPTVTPANIIDEVVAARTGGSTYASLDARLDTMDASIGGVPTTATLQTNLGQSNNVGNDTFLIWPEGNTSVPSFWTLTGAGGTVQRCGNDLALADANTYIGNFSARIRRVAAAVTLSQYILDANSFALAGAAFVGKTVGFGAWVRSTSIAGTRVYINDGVGTTYSAANVAANTWEWLSLSRTLNVAATIFQVGIINDVNGADAYISGATGMFTAAAPTAWIPCPTDYTTYLFFIDGAASVSTSRFVFQSARPGVVMDVQLIAGTSPTGAALIIDVNTWDGAAYTSMYATRPQIAAAGVSGGAQPDTTYSRRCLYGGFAATTLAGQRLSIDIDQVGSGVAGSNIGIMVRTLHYLRPFRELNGYNEELD